MKRRLGIDIDETIVYLLHDFLDWHNGEYDTELAEERFLSYRWWETLGCTKEEAYARAVGYIRTKRDRTHPSFHGLEFVEGSLQALDLLSRDYELYGITSRNSLWEEDTARLSSALYVEPDEGTFFPEIPLVGFAGEGLILPMDRIYSGSILGKTKLQLCQELGIDTLIDDDADVVRLCAEGGIHVYVPVRPWNRTLSSHPLIHRVRGWQEICAALSPHKVVLPDLGISFYL